MNRRIVLWRHGRTEWNVGGRVQGQSDIPLDEVGHEQAASAAARLATLKPSRIVSSDLVRAHDTAKTLADLVGLEVELEPRFREMNFGVREGLTVREAWAQFPEVMRTWGRIPEARIPRGETYAETGDRFATGMRRLVSTMEMSETVVVVSHGAALRTCICTFLGI
ncbi:MAG: histidine phosphatase family protein, partial [Nocardioidaceae bacterium]|nr:histidine phosphatase family protein [Nocardioidaceae bacterium]